MREFPSTLRLGPGGDFFIAKGGQEATTIGKHNGSILRISADGRTSTVLGYGFRQPQLGVNVRTGLVTASDQQGHYVPSTPLHIVKDHQFYGFLSDKLPREVYPAPIADPLTWIPHAVNASAMSQVWLFDAKMGPLNDALVHIGFNKPELFRVMLNNRGSRPQAAVVSVTQALEFPPLNGSVDPADGQLYIAGFQVLGWGTTSPRLAGLGRVRYTGGPSTLAREVAAMDKGILLRFDSARRSVKAANPATTPLRAGTTSEPTSTGRRSSKPTIPRDRSSRPERRLRLQGRPQRVRRPSRHQARDADAYRLDACERVNGTLVQDSASFTPYELTMFNPEVEGFGKLDVDLTPKTEVAEAAATRSAQKRAEESTSVSGASRATRATKAPSRSSGQTSRALRWQPDVPGRPDPRHRKRRLHPRVNPRADRQGRDGFGRTGMGMPSFAGVLTEQQIQSVILYIKSLK